METLLLTIPVEVLEQIADFLHTVSALSSTCKQLWKTLGRTFFLARRGKRLGHWKTLPGLTRTNLAVFDSRPHCHNPVRPWSEALSFKTAGSWDNLLTKMAVNNAESNIKLRFLNVIADDHHGVGKEGWLAIQNMATLQHLGLMLEFDEGEPPPLPCLVALRNKPLLQSLELLLVDVDQEFDWTPLAACSSLQVCHLYDGGPQDARSPPSPLPTIVATLPPQLHTLTVAVGYGPNPVSFPQLRTLPPNLHQLNLWCHDGPHATLASVLEPQVLPLPLKRLHFTYFPHTNPEQYSASVLQWLTTVPSHIEVKLTWDLTQTYEPFVGHTFPTMNPNLCRVVCCSNDNLAVAALVRVLPSGSGCQLRREQCAKWPPHFD
eukprot:TRINITY_DN52882_c0_g1_i1.p1 TRINITY_DN52882_c0_g1~~TRINITY_DN52882_c0_g1_i1.p1  ORF type:complete len:376 (-),score=14.88 TRINITY_DN52882_c0_g1_i1:212-1339(-)